MFIKNIRNLAKAVRAEVETIYRLHKAGVKFCKNENGRYVTIKAYKTKTGEIKYSFEFINLDVPEDVDISCYTPKGYKFVRCK